MGNEPWNPPHTVALAKAWYRVSACPFVTGAGKKKITFWDYGLIVYHTIYKRDGSIVSTPKRSTQMYRPRTARSLYSKWQKMQHDINAFLACDIRASYVVRRSSASRKDLRDDAKKFYVEKWRSKFMYEDAYNFLKGKK